jgi:CRISPR/Cas system-associated exonuclease Cas4 (RecB family)
MDKDQKEQKKFLEQQLQWSKEQACILEEIEEKLYEMKGLAEYALTHELSPIEINKLNEQLNDLKNEVHSLEKQLRSIVH